MAKFFMDKPLFGMYHVNYTLAKDKFYEFVNSDYMNCFLIESDPNSESFKKSMDEICKHDDKGAWIGVSRYGFTIMKNTATVIDNGEESPFNPVAIMHEDYKEKIDKFIADLKERGYYDHVIGFYMDEPLMWNITNDMLEAFTGYFRTVAAPDKRFFICFSVAGVAPESWTINDVKPINPKSSQYLTDIAFDMYHPWSDEYQKIVDLMIERSGNRDDLRIWMVPCVMNYRGDKTEEHCLEHLQKCYEMLSQFKKVGGLMCYNYYTIPPEIEALGNVGIDKLSDPSYKDYWPRLVQAIKDLGKKFVDGTAFDK